MREIKFRVWDKAIKAFISNTGNPNIFPFNGQIAMTCNGNSTGHISTDDYLQESYVLLQFTGLKDKSGKEIYEGDLLNIPFNEAIREGVHEVFYYKDGFVTSSILFKNKETANKNSLTWMINRGAEVIGNIQENPELIK